MKTTKPILKTLLLALLAGAALSGCIAVPVYESPRAYGPPAIVVGPVVRPYYGHRDYRENRGGRYDRW